MAETSSNRNLTKSAQSVVDKFTASWSYAQQNHHKRWERNLKLYNNKRWSPSYRGVTNTFVPLSFSTVETAVANLTSGRPSIDFMPQDMYRYIQTYQQTEEKPNLKALNSLFDYYWDCDNWDLKTETTVRTGFIYGLAAEYVYWDVDKPRIINLPTRDLILDPNLVDPMQLITNPNDYYTGRRYLTTLDALKEEQIVDPESGDLKPRFKNLSKVTPGVATGDQTDKEKKEMFMGSVGPTEGLVEVIELVTGERIQSVANRSNVIEDRKNELGIHNIGIHRFIADESIIYGKSIIDPIALPQELLNDVTNQSVDAVTDQLNPQWEIDPAFAEHIPKIKNAPGTVYPFPRGTLNMIVKQPVSPQAFNERQNIKNEIREATGIDQIVQGVGEDSQTTATEINAQLNQAGQRFTLFVRRLEREGLYQRAKIVYKMILHYVKERQLVPTSSVDGPGFYRFEPEQFDDTYEPKIQLESTVKSGKQRVTEESLQAYQALIADPSNDLYEVKKILYPKMFDLSEEELDRIIGAQKPETPMGGEGMGMEGMPPEGAAVPPDEDVELINQRLQAALDELELANGQA